MIELRESLKHEVTAFVDMENATDTSEFILPYTVEKHIAEMNQAGLIYLSIYDADKLTGFIILAIDDANEVEFRRIVVAVKGKGLGQAAMEKMELYCKTKLNCRRIWLDVFADNERGQHIYQKLGYKQFGNNKHNGRALILMEKRL